MAVSADRVASLVGQAVALHVTNGDEVRGELRSFDPVSNFLAMSVPTEAGSTARHWVVVRGAHVQSLEEVDDDGPETTDGGDDDPEVTVEALQKRERKALNKAVEDARHANSQVTNQTQNVYNALRKTMPVEWSGTDIVVMGIVTIRGPKYDADSCECADEPALNRVRKVLEGERRKLIASGDLVE